MNCWTELLWSSCTLKISVWITYTKYLFVSSSREFSMNIVIIQLYTHDCLMDFAVTLQDIVKMTNFSFAIFLDDDNYPQYVLSICERQSPMMHWQSNNLGITFADLSSTVINSSLTVLWTHAVLLCALCFHEACLHSLCFQQLLMSHSPDFISWWIFVYRKTSLFGYLF